ncbi:hypothetical protein [Rhizobium laguerreae]|uniref:hypothetical protein n=1 Tax=Rhizobium laguerreae TaxID=1076926 RepID=UPI001C92611B|nr:hypothetical protein [Rhizobium laguerreae]MBY3206882.1 hypothetical protein [Rhizobium laguerreae]
MELNLDELEAGNFLGRTHAGVVYTVGDKWVLAVGDRDSAQTVAQLLEPVGDQGWTVVLEKRSRDEEYAWGPTVVGCSARLSYAEAEQVAYAFLTEGEVEFDFHRCIALSIWGGMEFGQITAMLSERYDERRSVHLKKEADGWFAMGAIEKWDEHVIWFVQKNCGARFPEQGYGNLEAVRAMAYDWLVQPALGDEDRASAWWLRNAPYEIVVSKVTYLGYRADHAA